MINSVNPFNKQAFVNYLNKNQSMTPIFTTFIEGCSLRKREEQTSLYKVVDYFSSLLRGYIIVYPKFLAFFPYGKNEKNQEHKDSLEAAKRTISCGAKFGFGHILSGTIDAAKAFSIAFKGPIELDEFFDSALNNPDSFFIPIKNINSCEKQVLVWFHSVVRLKVTSDNGDNYFITLLDDGLLDISWYNKFANALNLRS